MKTGMRVCWLAAATLGLVALVGSRVSAQPPAGKEVPAQMDPAVEEWIKMLIEKLGDKNEAIRDSAREALAVIGQPALPALRNLVVGTDVAKADLAKKLISRIEAAKPPEKDVLLNPGEVMGADGKPLPIDDAVKDLNLTDKQKPQVDRIVNEHKTKTRELNNRARTKKLKKGEIRQEQEKLQEDLVNNLKGVLNKDQMAKVEKKMKQPRQPKQPKKPGGKKA